jgi:hypothetical protein
MKGESQRRERRVKEDERGKEVCGKRWLAWLSLARERITPGEYRERERERENVLTSRLSSSLLSRDSFLFLPSRLLAAALPRPASLRSLALSRNLSVSSARE